VAERLLHALTLAPDDRAALIGRLYHRPDGRAFANLLIDFEEDPQLGLEVAQALKELGAARPGR
jgi:hypothetical protein